MNDCQESLRNCLMAELFSDACIENFIQSCVWHVLANGVPVDSTLDRKLRDLAKAHELWQKGKTNQKIVEKIWKEVQAEVRKIKDSAPRTSAERQQLYTINSILIATNPIQKYSLPAKAVLASFHSAQSIYKAVEYGIATNDFRIREKELRKTIAGLVEKETNVSEKSASFISKLIHVLDEKLERMKEEQYSEIYQSWLQIQNMWSDLLFENVNSISEHLEETLQKSREVRKTEESLLEKTWWGEWQHYRDILQNYEDETRQEATESHSTEPHSHSMAS